MLTVRRITLCVVGLMLFIAIVGYVIPAHWVAQGVARASGERVRIAHARGWWHDGSGLLLLTSGSGGADAVYWPQRVAWRVRPAGGVLTWVAQIAWPDAGGPLTVTVRIGLPHPVLHVGAWQGRIPLPALAGLGAPFNTLALTGDARVDLPAIALPVISAQSERAPDLRIHIASLRSALAPGAELGDYEVLARLTPGNPRGAAFTLNTLRGALQLSGAGQCLWQRRGSCSFEGQAQAAQHDEALLGNLLGLLGKRKTSGNSPIPVTELRW